MRGGNVSKYRLLDLFCKAGGAGMGYHFAGFEVVGVDTEFIGKHLMQYLGIIYMTPLSETKSKEFFSDLFFLSGVFAPDTGHHSAAGARIDYISH
jgi:hypothetical protein